MSCSCSGCYYQMVGEESPTGKEWCGWLGGDPDPGGRRCHFVRQSTERIPKGLAIARSLRIVSQADLAAENEAFSDLAGGLLH